MPPSRLFAFVVSLIVLAGAAPVVQHDDGVTVFVTSTRSASPTPTDEDRGLEDAARELRDALAHKKGLRIVDTADEATIRVEVTNREQRDAGEGGYGGIKLTPLVETIIRFHATAADGADIDLKGVGEGYWSRAAKDGADHLVKWIGRHRARTARAATPNSQLPTPNSQLPTPNSQLPTPNSQLPTPNAQLPTPNSSRRVARESGAKAAGIAGQAAFHPIVPPRSP